MVCLAHRKSDTPTYDFLNTLDHPELAIEPDAKKESRAKPGFNPYERNPAPVKPKKRPR